MMGILHIAGLGIHPGAVTCGLSYLKHLYGESKESQHRELWPEGVVLLTSKEVVEGKVRECIWNEYGKEEQKKGKNLSNLSAIEIIKQFYEEEIGEGEVWCCVVNVNDFSDCFDKVARIVLKFHPPGKVGKHIWANITGGTNVLNAAIFEVAYLSMSIAKIYYTFISDVSRYGKYLQPFKERPDDKDFGYREILVFKTIFDRKVIQILEELEEAKREEGKKVTPKELLSRLKRNYEDWRNADEEDLKKNYLAVMNEILISHRGEEISLEKEGEKYLRITKEKLFRALTLKESLSPSELNFQEICKKVWPSE